MPRSVLTSPGMAIAEREALELDLASEISRDLRAFLMSVERDAAEALSGPVVLAAGSVPEPFSRGRVMRWWTSVADKVTKKVVDWMGDPPQDPFVASMIQRVHNAPLPGKVYADVREVLVLATSEGWEVERASQALSKALEAQLWQPGARRIVRTESTAAHAHVALKRLAAEGYERKRWVTRHDSAVRPSHKDADGQVRALSEEFVVGGFGLLVPADPSAPPAETASCRCVIVGVP